MIDPLKVLGHLIDGNYVRLRNGDEYGMTKDHDVVVKAEKVWLAPHPKGKKPGYKEWVWLPTDYTVGQFLKLCKEGGQYLDHKHGPWQEIE